MGYIKLFNNMTAYQNYINGKPLLPNVSLVEEDEIVFYTPEGVENEYMYIEALEDGMIVSFTHAETSISYASSLYYSLDKQEWEEFRPYEGTFGTTPAINAGEKVYFKAKLIPKKFHGIGTFAINKQCNVAGNIMSLLSGDEFVNDTTISGHFSNDYAFKNLFNNCTTIQSAENLILPATTLTTSCYSNMFCGCASLTTAPELPATTLTDSCYWNMFDGCSSLVTAPELPATTLADNCYWSMFYGCTKLQVVTKSEFIAFNDTNSGFNGILKDCYMPKNQNVIINLSDTDEVIFNYSGGIYSALREETILTDILSQEDISTLTPEYDLVVTVYDNYPDPHIVDTTNICEHITWEAGQSLKEFAEKFSFDYNNTSISILYTSRKGGDYYYYD